MIVAIESASTDISLAVAATDGTPLASDGWSSDHRQGHDLMPRLLALLKAHDNGVAGISCLAIGTGPGSFTGLRVGMSVAKGLAYALGRPIIGIPSLESWLASVPEAKAAVGRAGAREAYLLIRGEAEARIMQVDQLPRGPDAGPLVAPTELHGAFGLSSAVAPLRAAEAMARLAAGQLEQHPDGDDLARLEPAYLRLPRGLGQLSTEPMQWP